MKLELTISKDYVPNWTIIDGVRELFQNAIDQEVQDPTNTMSWEYDELAGTLTISNANAKLESRTLLLGTTSKAKDSSTIGQFGEGYKIATLVLIRNGLDVTFYNRSLKQIWRPRFVKSRRYGTDVLTFFIERDFSFFDTTKEKELSIVVSNVTPEIWADIVASNLRLRDDYEVIYKCAYGEVIKFKDANVVYDTVIGQVVDNAEVKRAGRVFVNGLFVKKHTPYTLSYNFSPAYIKLDRDRKMASDFDLQWMASRVWSSASLEARDNAALMSLLVDLVKRETGDVTYLVENSVPGSLYSYCYDDFIKQHGSNAVPVSSHNDLMNVPIGYTGVLVPSSLRRLIIGSSEYIAPALTATPEPLRVWFDKYCNQLSSEAYDELVEIMEELNV